MAKTSSPLLRRARLRASYRLLRAASFLSSGAARAAQLATSFALHALDREDRGELTAALYDSQVGGGRSVLFEWEAEWLARDLPAPPARVLLGGAGRGREARWLTDRGYTVTAFDPSRASVAQHAASCPEVPCSVLDYEALARASQAMRRGEASPAAAALVLGRAPYDAALLGWGSLSHVLDERAQDALFESLAALVPHGPILASFFVGAWQSAGRARMLGARLGSALGPGADAHLPDRDRVRCLPHAGFTYSFDRARLEQLAQCAARRLALHEGAGYPHATFKLS